MAYNQQYGQRSPQGAPPGQRPPQGYPPQPQGGRGGGYPPGPAPNQYNNGQPPQQQYGQQPPAQVRVCSFCLFEGSNDILLIFPFSLSLLARRPARAISSTSWTIRWSRWSAASSRTIPRRPARAIPGSSRTIRRASSGRHSAARTGRGTGAEFQRAMVRSLLPRHGAA